MKSQTSFSFHSNSQLGGRRLEESILNDYRRVIFDQSSLCFEAETLQYCSLPSNIPSPNLLHSHCICLDGHFYQVFTIAIFQYLLREPTPKRIQKIQKFKNLICCDKFLPQAGYLKGLLLKGLKGMIENSENIHQPIAVSLLGSDKITAFTECWKEMICQSSKFVNQEREEARKSLISVLTTFFDVDLHMFTLRGQTYEKEVIPSLKKSKEKTAIIPLILISNHYLSEGDQSLKEESFSSISSIQGYWSYYLLVNYPHLSASTKEHSPSWKKRENENNKQKTLLVEYPQLFEEQHFEKVATKKQKRDIFLKGENLIDEMKKFLSQIQKIKKG